MPKVPLNSITSGYGTVDALNANFDAIEAAFDNTLSRDGDTPNQMVSNLDMNGFSILNQGNPVTVEGFNWEGQWLTATAYQVGDVIQQNGSAYICVIAHTSGVFATDLAALRWQLVAQANLPTQTGNSGKYLTTNGTSASWDDVKYTPLGTGAVQRTVAGKLQEYVSVKDFGAVGDGVANDTAAFNACIAALTRGQAMYIPKGVYVVASTLTINKSINILGESKFDSIIYASGFTSDQSILNFTGSTGARIQDLVIDNVSFWSNNNLARGLTLTWVNKSSFSNLYFYNLYRGVYGDNAWSNTWKNISAYNITTELFNYAAECNNNHFDKVEFRGSTGIKVTGNTAALKFTACDFEGITSVSGYGCLLAPVTGSAISGVVFDACYFENIQGAAIACAGVDANSVKGLVVKGCYLFGGRTLIFGTVGSAVNAIVLTNTSGFRISENVFLDWQSNAIFRDGTENNGVVENNVLSITPALTNSSNLMSISVNVKNNTFGRKEQFSSAIPTTGTYTSGDFVWNLSPTKDVNNMVLLGWSRTTNGSAHVLGTDWMRVYVSHTSPAT